MAGALSIDRFHLTGIAPSNHPDAGHLRHALGRVDRGRLMRNIGSAVGDFGSNDDRFIVLRRLELVATEGAIGDPDALARQLAEGVRAALVRLADMGPNETIVSFASRAARIGAFVTATAKGEASGKWWFSDLDHLKVLPVSSAIRVALAREPLSGLEALGALADSDLARVIQCLSDADAADLLGDFAEVLDADGSEDPWVDVFVLPRAAELWPQNKAILHDLAVLARQSTPTRAALTAIHARVEIARARDPAALIEALRTGSIRTLVKAAPGLCPSVLAAVASLKASTRRRIADELQAAQEQAPSAVFTPFGGMLLLWPHLPPIDAARLPPSSSSPIGLLSLIALASLFGPEAGAVFEDPALREIAGTDPHSAVEDLAEWLSQVAPDLLPQTNRNLQRTSLPAVFAHCREQSRPVRQFGLAALDDFARRLPGLATASLPFLRANLLGTGAHVFTGEETVRAVLDRPPLDVLLSMTGLADRTILLPDGRLLNLERAE